MMQVPTSRPARLAVTFWGAAQAVTGSMHLVQAAGRKVLLDCGAVKSSWHEPRPSPWTFPFEPGSLDAVVLSHAHMDHCGNLPYLVRQGFAGPIYCTPPTRDLLALMLGESAHGNEEEARVRSILRAPLELGGRPFFTSADVERTLARCVSVPYGERREVCPGVELLLTDAGHLLGSAAVHLRVDAAGREASLTFTGDLGRGGSPLLHDPAPLPAADLLISECTYGGRSVEPLARAAEGLADVVWKAYDQGGRVLIPAFSLGRTQVVAHTLLEGIRRGDLPDLPVYVDSPVAAAIADVHLRHPDRLRDPAAVAALGATALAGPAGGVGARPDGPAVRYVYSQDESRDLSTDAQPGIIIAPGGMCEGLRVTRHLKQVIDDPRCSVALVSYQAPHTIGRRLLVPGPRVRFHGRNWNRWADVVELPGFSGHPDRDELRNLLVPLAGRARQVYLVHGEPEQADALAQTLRAAGFADVTVPAHGATVTLD